MRQIECKWLLGSREFVEIETESKIVYSQRSVTGLTLNRVIKNLLLPAFDSKVGFAVFDSFS